MEVLAIFDSLDGWSGKKPIFRRLKDKVRPPVPSTKEVLAFSVYKLQAAQTRLKNTGDILSKRDRMCLDKCVEAQLDGDRIHAIMYANECAEVRQLAKLILSSELSIEQAILRLETAEKLADVIDAVIPIAQIVGETRDRLAGVIPTAASQLNDVNNALTKTLKDMGTAKIHTPFIEAHSEEALSILEQANAAAEEQIRERFPELPKEVLLDDSEGLPGLPKSVPMPEQPMRIAVALDATGGVSTLNSSIEDRVYDYIKSCKGQVTVLQCASYLGVLPYDVESAIGSLKKEGRIELR